MTNKLVQESAKSLVSSDQVSRANYKLILTVLMQKNGFMKVNRLKSLCASGKLSVPLLPHKGAWRCLTRLDQFALKRASAEAANEKPRQESIVQSSSSKFVSRIAGRKGKREMVKQHLGPLLRNGVDGLRPLVEILVADLNFSGLAEVLELSESSVSKAQIETVLEHSVSGYKSSIQDTFVHAIVREKSLPLPEKRAVLTQLLEYEPVRQLLNQVNLNHETPLVVAAGIAKTVTEAEKQDWQKIASLFISKGADVYLCDKKGVFYEPIVQGG